MLNFLKIHKYQGALILCLFILSSCFNDPNTNTPKNLLQGVFRTGLQHASFFKGQSWIRVIVNNQKSVISISSDSPTLDFKEGEQSTHIIRVDILDTESSYNVNLSIDNLKTLLSKNAEWKYNKDKQEATITWKPELTFNKEKESNDIRLNLRIELSDNEVQDNNKYLKPFIIHRSLTAQVKKTYEPPEITGIAFNSVLYKKLEDENFYLMPSTADEAISLRLDRKYNYNRVSKKFDYAYSYGKSTQSYDTSPTLSNEARRRLKNPIYEPKTGQICLSSKYIKIKNKYIKVDRFTEQDTIICYFEVRDLDEKESLDGYFIPDSLHKNGEIDFKTFEMPEPIPSNISPNTNMNIDEAVYEKHYEIPEKLLILVSEGKYKEIDLTDANNIPVRKEKGVLCGSKDNRVKHDLTTRVCYFSVGDSVLSSKNLYILDSASDQVYLIPKDQLTIKFKPMPQFIKIQLAGQKPNDMSFILDKTPYLNGYTLEVYIKNKKYLDISPYLVFSADDNHADVSKIISSFQESTLFDESNSDYVIQKLRYRFNLKYDYRILDVFEKYLSSSEKESSDSEISSSSSTKIENLFEIEQFLLNINRSLTTTLTAYLGSRPSKPIKMKLYVLPRAQTVVENQDSAIKPLKYSGPRLSLSDGQGNKIETLSKPAAGISLTHKIKIQHTLPKDLFGVAVSHIKKANDLWKVGPKISLGNLLEILNIDVDLGFRFMNKLTSCTQEETIIPGSQIWYSDQQCTCTIEEVEIEKTYAGLERSCTLKTNVWFFKQGSNFLQYTYEADKLNIELKPELFYKGYKLNNSNYVRQDKEKFKPSKGKIKAFSENKPIAINSKKIAYNLEPTLDCLTDSVSLKKKCKIIYLLKFVDGFIGKLISSLEENYTINILCRNENNQDTKCDCSEETKIKASKVTEETRRPDSPDNGSSTSNIEKLKGLSIVRECSFDIKSRGQISVSLSDRQEKTSFLNEVEGGNFLVEKNTKTAVLNY